MGYFRDGLKGISWMGILRALIRVLTIVKLGIVARILSANDLGIYGLALLMLSLFEILSETGINVFLIQELYPFKKYLNSAFAVSIIRGTLISILLLISAKFISSYFNSPDSLIYILLISFVPFIKGFINPSIVKLQKELKFSKEFLIRILIFFTDSVVAIVWTIVNRNATGLIAGMICGALVELLMSHIFIKPTPHLNFDINKVRYILRRGKWVTLGGIIQYVYLNIDNFIVAKIFGSSFLGLYQMSNKISTIPVTEVSDVLNKVTFPIFMKLSFDINRLKKAYFKTIFSMGLFLTFISLILYFYTYEIVLFVLGDSWISIVSVVKILAFYALVRSILNENIPLYYSVKKQEYFTYTALASILIIAVGMFPLMKVYGIRGIAYSMLFGTLLTIPIHSIFVYKIFKKLK